MKEMLLAQQQSSDQWAFYQAKVIREHLYRAQKLGSRPTCSSAASLKPEAREKLERCSRSSRRKRSATTTRRRTSRRRPRGSSTSGTATQARDPYFLFAEALLQIAIVMASVSILAPLRVIFSFSLGLAVIGAVLTLNGYFLLFQLPFMHGAGH